MQNVAVVDGSQWRGVGGWGIRLITPRGIEEWCGRLPRRTEIGTCEARAILEAVRHAPKGERLTIWTDASGIAQSMKTGRSRSAEITMIALEVQKTAKKRGITLDIRWKGREGKHQKAAHELARMGRLAIKTPTTWSEAKILTDFSGKSIHLEIKRPEIKSVRADQKDQPGHVIRERRDLKDAQGLPSAVTALQHLIKQLRDGERVKVTTDSPLLDIWIEQGFSAIRCMETRRALTQASRDLRRRNITMNLAKKERRQP